MDRGTVVMERKLCRLTCKRGKGVCGMGVRKCKVKRREACDCKTWGQRLISFSWGSGEGTWEEGGDLAGRLAELKRACAALQGSIIGPLTQGCLRKQRLPLDGSLLSYTQ